MNSEIDARHVLPVIRVPTLILHRAGDTRITAEAGRYLAANITGARYVELPGIDHLPLGERDIVDRIIDEAEEFLTHRSFGRRAGPGAGDDNVHRYRRVRRSAPPNSVTGNGRLLDWHDDAVRQQLARFRGHEVKNLADGFMAIFDGPARAVRCATAISQAVRPLGITVRSGLHTGEIELKHDDVAGIAVHIAARSRPRPKPERFRVKDGARPRGGVGAALRGSRRPCDKGPTRGDTPFYCSRPLNNE